MAVTTFNMPAIGDINANAYFSKRATYLGNNMWVATWFDSSTSIRWAYSTDDTSTWTLSTSTITTDINSSVVIAGNHDTKDSYIVYNNAGLKYRKLTFDSANKTWSQGTEVTITTTGDFNYPQAEIDLNAYSSGALHIYVRDSAPTTDEYRLYTVNLSDGTVTTPMNVATTNGHVPMLEVASNGDLFLGYRSGTDYYFNKAVINSTKDGWTLGTAELMFSRADGIGAYGAHSYLRDDGTFVFAHLDNYVDSSSVTHYVLQTAIRHTDGVMEVDTVFDTTNTLQSVVLVGDPSKSGVDVYFLDKSIDDVYTSTYDGTSTWSNPSSFFAPAEPTQSMAGSHIENGKAIIFWTQNTSMINQGTKFSYNTAPNAPTIDSPVGTSTSPAITSATPTIDWTHSDPDSGDSQSAYEVNIYNGTTLVHGTGKVVSTNTFFDVPSTLSLASGTTYNFEVRTWDSADAVGAYSALEYFKVNKLPTTPTIVDPADTERTPLAPVFTTTISDDVENDNQNFVIQLAEDSAFSVGLQERNTETSQTGWEVFDGTNWVAFPSGGVDYTFESKDLRYTWQTNLTEGKTYYWRIAPIDATSGLKGSYSSYRSIRVGDTLSFSSNPYTTDAMAARVMVVLQDNIATDGTVPASVKIEACNNANDTSPTWEDMTSAYNNGTYHSFSNSSKTANNWGVAVRVTVTANDSLNPIEIDGIGFSID